MKLYVRHAGGELTVPDQKEFLLLWNRGVIAGDDLVRREGVERWVPAADLPWIRGLREGNRADGQRLVRVTLLVMAAALGAVLWLQSRVAPKPRPAQPPAAERQPVPAEGQNSVHFRAR
jgi:hypothetical protein